ncbi:MAG: hypothetical protein ACE5IG_04810 [Dehalococcoidia bacterium]
MAQPSLAGERHRMFIDVPEELHRRMKAAAALEGLTLREWIIGLALDRLDEDEDLRIALERLQDREDSIRWEHYKRERRQRALPR